MKQDQDCMPSGIELPNRIFITGVPGSKWSGISQVIESLDGFNTSDRNKNRTYDHKGFTGHQGIYFGKGMELEALLDAEHIDSAWDNNDGCRLIKSHDWAYHLSEIETEFPTDWIMLVYRPDHISYAWWHEAGGFNIEYPSYDSYINSTNMLGEISKRNQLILEYAASKDLSWNYFTSAWIENTFGRKLELSNISKDVLVTIYKK